MSVTQAEVEEFLDYKWPNVPGGAQWIPHVPHAGPQELFLMLDDVPEILYGGAAGGGKSDALLMAALQYVDVPGYAALLLRKTFAELNLENALMDRAMKWLAHTPAAWNGNDMRWRFPSGATLQFGYLKSTTDRARYQSAEFQFIGFDELTTFEEADYRFMFSRMRKPSSGPLSRVPLRMRAGSNPGGRGHKWVKDRFPITGPPKDGVAWQQRTFIPARLDDNPSVDQETYKAGLGLLDPNLMQQLLEGNWGVRDPGHWMIGNQEWIDAAVELGRELWADRAALPAPEIVLGFGSEAGPRAERTEIGLAQCIDWGEHTQGYVIWGLPHGGIFVPPSEVVAAHLDPAETTQRLLSVVLDGQLPYSFREARYDAAGVQSMRTYVGVARKQPGLERLRSVKVPFGQFKRETIGYLRLLFYNAYAGSESRYIAIHPANEELIRQLHAWERKDEETDEAVKEDDHGPDALIAGVAPIARYNRNLIAQMKNAAFGDTDTAYQPGWTEEVQERWEDAA